ncbi:UNVERIFIED_CONTAM: hypothetical protein FKN15_011982 [Acipenser sinensis]
MAEDRLLPGLLSEQGVMKASSSIRTKAGEGDPRKPERGQNSKDLQGPAPSQDTTINQQ